MLTNRPPAKRQDSTAPYRDDPVTAARVANIRARPELERRAADGYRPEQDDDGLARRVERLERDQAGLVRILQRAGLVAVTDIGEVTLRGAGDPGSLLSNIEDAHNLGAMGIERQDAA